jgi:hypothetical protein
MRRPPKCKTDKPQINADGSGSEPQKGIRYDLLNPRLSAGIRGEFLFYVEQTV